MVSRQQRRQRERLEKKFDKRTAFTKKEVEEANSAAYEYGKRLALQAAKEVMGLGETRLDRIKKRLTDLEYQTFIKPFERGR